MRDSVKDRFWKTVMIFLPPTCEDEGNAKTVKLQSYDSSVTMKEALGEFLSRACGPICVEEH